MKLDEIAGSGNNEYYTPLYAITPIEKYLTKGTTIWCPFDDDRSLYVQYFKSLGYTVINTHLSTGDDFFTCEVPKCDYIISNPPYSLKNEVLERLFELRIPFAMLFGVVGIFESQKRFDMFRNNDFEVLYFNRRVSYFKSYEEPKPSMNPPFSSVYICHHILPHPICFQEIQK